MRKQDISKRLFRLFAAMMVFALAFAQVASVAKAQDAQPPKRVKDAPVNLDEVVNYYSRMGEIKGEIGVVVELSDKPASVVFSQNLAQSIEQVNVIEQNQAAFVSDLQNTGLQYTELFRAQKAYNGIWMRVDSSALKTLASLPGVKALHPIISKTLDNTASVPLIGAPQVWAGAGQYQGENIKIGIIDTGIDYLHTNFGGPGAGYNSQDFTTLGEGGNLFPTAKVVGGWDFVGDDYGTTGYIPVPDADPMDCNGHGSHVAGTTAGFGVLPGGATYTEGGSDTYAALAGLTSADYISKFDIGPGVAPKAELYALRVFGCSGSTDVVVAAIEWAMDPNGDGDLSDHLDVINMSLGSSFGTISDPDSVATDNAAKAGVIVVASAGNSGDVYYVTGSPGAAPYAISVASSVDAGAVLSAFEVTANTATVPAAPINLYAASEAAFGPQSYNLSGVLAAAVPANGCAALTNAAAVAGKIALIDRGICSFDVKVQNAEDAGAIGVLIANNVNTFPTGMGASGTPGVAPTIPAMMTTAAIGTLLKTDLAASGVVTVLLTTNHHNAFVMTDPTVVDNVSSFSSRGPARGGTILKPDISAPGDSIFSTAYGSGTGGESLSGTSMAAPHMTGVMALLRQEHPEWSVAELKALAMNTATNDLWTGASLSGNKHTPTRQGAGRVNLVNATNIDSNVIAYYKNDPGQVNVSFGFVDVVETGSVADKTLVKSITLANKGGSAASYNVSFDQRYLHVANAGLTFTLLNAVTNATLSNPVSIPANGSIDIKVQIILNAEQLTRARDVTISTTSGRERFSEGGGYVVLTDSVGSAPVVRVPVHIAARPASSMSTAENSLYLPPAATGAFTLNPAGVEVNTLDDTSLVYVSELKYESPNEASSALASNSADLKYVGISSNLSVADYATGSAFFSIATYGDWDTLHATEFDIYVDTNEDGVDDYVIYNTHTGSAASPTNTMMSAVYNLNTGTQVLDDYINWYGGAVNTNTFQNNVMTMDVTLAHLGLSAANPHFNFYVVSFTNEAVGAVDVSDLLHYDLSKESFLTVNPVEFAPVWSDISSSPSPMTIGYNRANIAANQSKGLLLLHQHNAANTAQVLTFPKIDTYIGGALKGSSYVPSGVSTTGSYANLSAGPVLVKEATNATPIIAGERVVYTVNGVPTSYSETMGLPTSKASTSYLFPWYNNLQLNSQLRFGNVGTAPTTVSIKIHGVTQPTTYTLAAGASGTATFPVSDGPVEVFSSNTQKITAAIRVVYTVNGVATSYSELMGLPTAQASLTALFPWYNNVNLSSQLRFSNVGTNATVVTVKVHGVAQATTYPLAAGASTTATLAGISDGPIELVSSDPLAPIVAAMRVVYAVNGVNTSYSELMGLPGTVADTTAYFPWYNNVNLNSQLRFSNVGAVPTTVTIRVHGVDLATTYTLAPGASTTASLVGVSDGPVELYGSSVAPIVAAIRVVYTVNGTATSYSELMGLPASQLDYSYLFPLYNNIQLNSQLRFGVPTYLP